MLIGCSSAPLVQTPSLAQYPIDKPRDIHILPDPPPIKLRDIKWRVLTPSTIPSTEPWVFIGLSPKDYENLSINQAEILRYITESKWRLDYYKKEIEQ